MRTDAVPAVDVRDVATAGDGGRRDGADRIRTGVLPHAVKARQPLRYEPRPAGDHTSKARSAAPDHRRVPLVGGARVAPDETVVHGETGCGTGRHGGWWGPALNRA